MFADDINLFYSNKDINTAFLKENDELQKINESFISNKPSKKDDIPLVLLKLNINDSENTRTESVKVFGVLLDENLSWKTRIKYIEIRSQKISVYYLKQRHS